MQYKIAFVSDRLVEFHSFLKSTNNGEFRIDLYDHLEAIRKSIQMIYYDLFILDIHEEWFTIPFWMYEQANHKYHYQIILIADHPLPDSIRRLFGNHIFKIIDFETAKERLAEIFEEAKSALEKHNFPIFKPPHYIRWRPDRLVGKDESIRRANEFIEIISKTRSTPCLIQGEKGTGKNLVSYLIHSSGQATTGPFITKNCEFATTNELLADIFGVADSRTAFGAPRKGLLEQANGGTLVLKNIEHLPLEVQHKLLLYLDSHIIKPVGAERPIPVETRIIAHTRFNLENFVRNGRFNSELYFHLKSFEIYLPPLRDRRRDIELLVKYFIQHFSFQFAKKPKKISPMALNILKDYYWPGNVQELRELLERSVLISKNSELSVKDLPGYLSNSGELPDDVDLLGNCALKEIERVHIERVLARTKGNKSKAAEILQISRTTLREKIKSYGLGN